MDQPLTPFEALQLAVTKAGSQSELARMCGISQPAVWRWVQSTKRVPPEYVLRIEAQTGVSRHHLRPDIYPPACIDEPPVDELPELPGNVDCDRKIVPQAKDAA